MEEILPKMKKFVLKNSETRFQNAKTALSRIFFARPGMDFAQKSLLTTLKFRLMVDHVSVMWTKKSIHSQIVSKISTLPLTKAIVEER